MTRPHLRAARIAAALLAVAVPWSPVPLVGPAAATARTPAQQGTIDKPIGTVRRANRMALQEPASSHYRNASQVYHWSEGALFRLFTAPEQVSDIALQAGETLVSVAAGDTVRWVIGDTISGSGAGQRTHVLVKPSATGLRTNLVITTSRRAYHIQLQSTAGTAMASISWTYPEDALIVRRAAPSGPDLHPVVPEQLNFNYKVSGDRPRWRPLRAYDDGRQVFIEFPAALAQSEAPPLFVIGASKQAELVNYRLRGRFYVVDRLFDRAELRLGERRQQVVRITRTGGSWEPRP